MSVQANRKATQRSYAVLAPEKRTEEVAEAIWIQHCLPCVFSFKQDKVYWEKFTRQNFLSIHRFCKECGAHSTGSADVEPLDGEKHVITFPMADTRNVPHTTKRQLRGIKRQIIGEDLCYHATSVFR